jgi:hypothetical protein
MAFVLDASVAAVWAFTDESSPLATLDGALIQAAPLCGVPLLA